MTENELRQKVVDTARVWLGTRTGSNGHRKIMEIYNAQRPLPRGTRIQESWPWCAVFVSVVSLQCDLRDILPTEMSCHQMLLAYKQLGRWVENDAYVPTFGDIIMYDWNDGTNYASTDNTGTPDHVGIVIACDGTTITVIEGNNSNKVALRYLAVNGRYIRGFAVPDYASKADKNTEVIPTEPEKPAEPAKPTLTEAEIDAMARDVIRGKYGNGAARRATLGENYRVVQDRANAIIRGAVAPGEPAEPTKKVLTEEEINTIAHDVILGKYGNGPARRAALGENYRVIQDRVNAIAAETWRV